MRNINYVSVWWSNSGIVNSGPQSQQVGCTQGRNCTLEADIFLGILRDGRQIRYESCDWDGTGKNVSGSRRDRE